MISAVFGVFAVLGSQASLAQDVEKRSVLLDRAIARGDCRQAWDIAETTLGESIDKARASTSLQPGAALDTDRAWTMLASALACKRASSCDEALAAVKTLPPNSAMTWKMSGESIESCQPEKWLEAYQAYRKYEEISGNPPLPQVVTWERERLGVAEIVLAEPVGVPGFSWSQIDAFVQDAAGAPVTLRREGDNTWRLRGQTPGELALRVSVPSELSDYMQPYSESLRLVAGPQRFVIAIPASTATVLSVPAYDPALALRLWSVSKGQWLPIAAGDVPLPSGTRRFSFGPIDEAARSFEASVMPPAPILQLPSAVELVVDGEVLATEWMPPGVGVWDARAIELPYPANSPLAKYAGSQMWTATFQAPTEAGKVTRYEVNSADLSTFQSLERIRIADEDAHRHKRGAIVRYSVAGALVAGAGGALLAAGATAETARTTTYRDIYGKAASQTRALYGTSLGAAGLAAATVGLGVTLDMSSWMRQRSTRQERVVVDHSDITLPNTP